MFTLIGWGCTLPTFLLKETTIKDYINFMRSITVIAQNAIFFLSKHQVTFSWEKKLVDNYTMFCWNNEKQSSPLKQ
jgi:hypothetical protein